MCLFLDTCFSCCFWSMKLILSILIVATKSNLKIRKKLILKNSFCLFPMRGPENLCGAGIFFSFSRIIASAEVKRMYLVCLFCFLFWTCCSFRGCWKWLQVSSQHENMGIVELLQNKWCVYKHTIYTAVSYLLLCHCLLEVCKFGLLISLSVIYFSFHM